MLINLAMVIIIIILFFFAFLIFMSHPQTSKMENIHVSRLPPLYQPQPWPHQFRDGKEGCHVMIGPNFGIILVVVETPPPPMSPQIHHFTLRYRNVETAARYETLKNKDAFSVLTESLGRCVTLTGFSHAERVGLMIGFCYQKKKKKPL